MRGADGAAKWTMHIVIREYMWIIYLLRNEHSLFEINPPKGASNIKGMMKMYKYPLSRLGELGLYQLYIIVCIQRIKALAAEASCSG